MYSRKVEHVYQLVLRTIEFLTQQKHANADATKNSDKNGAEDGDDTAAGEVRNPYRHEPIVQSTNVVCATENPWRRYIPPKLSSV